MRAWLLLGGFVCLAVAAVWLGVRSRAPAPPAEAVAAPVAPTAPPTTHHRARYTPRPTLPGAPAVESTPEAPAAPRPRRERTGAPRFDPALEKLVEAAQRGDLEKAAAEGGFKLSGDRVRVVVRADLGGGEKARAAITAAGGEVLRTVQRGEDHTIHVALVPVRALRTLAENEAVRNVHRPVGIHAVDAPPRPSR